MRVAIVGAGPTGLLAANLLGQAGIETVLLERNPGLTDHPRAITIDDEGLRICQAIGLVEEICGHALLNRAAHYVSRGRYLVKIAPAQHPYGYPQISTFHQPTFEAILLKGLARFSCVQIHFEVNVKALAYNHHGVTLQLEKRDGSIEELEFAYVLACDGGRSAIRQQLEIPLRSVRFWQLLDLRGRGRRSSKRSRQERSQRWLVVDTVDTMAAAPAIIFFCNPARPAVTVPAPNGGRRWEFMLKPDEQEEDLLSEVAIAHCIQQALHSLPPKDRTSISSMATKTIRKTMYTFHTTIAERFSVGQRIFLMGDAAHQMPPFGGQGMNSGLRDASNLCWKLQLVIQQQTTPQILASYQQERLPHVIQMIMFSSTLGSLIMPTWQPLAIARDLVLNAIHSIPPLRRLLTDMEVKPQPHYRSGFLLPHGGPWTGKLIPQPLVSDSAGQRLLLDQVMGNAFSILRISDNPVQAFEPFTHKLWSKLATQYICLTTTKSVERQSKNIGNIHTITDESGQLASLLKQQPDRFLIARPDHYCMGIFHISELAHVEQTLIKLLDYKPVKIKETINEQ
ncbi:3-(3-hydroxy-phenyl)propionate/3-hydroxycinnamic acid hydroxylase [Dictyobacter alpinus]|uniref:3-(3-hydroxy-phenyl)propionate/3-hydroxycinnamic acid hydroxylase n=1 Tax=Dictyobacter alpinus TaxID=2014873 RepID=A0A402B7G0_9CHLR|nr:FAD-dependent monooxygenase [Dictyobacter alpinus]GCE27333.1 3-(3-hydroxy-phenyl)propionate/3-hydroxycinnamic acid hydroxylase [Dictyobacter alpinus]